MIAIAKASPGNDAGMPPRAGVLCAFANTLDVDVDAPCADSITTAAELTAWLRARDLLGPDERANAADLDIARTFRAGLRAAMHRHHDDDHAETVTELDAAAARLPLRIVFDGTHPRLTPAATGAKAALAHLLVAVAESESDNTWTRLKVCIADDCQLAFYDTSKNRSRHWCSMGVCGNRQKTRTYRSRRR